MAARKACGKGSPEKAKEKPVRRPGTQVRKDAGKDKVNKPFSSPCLLDEDDPQIDPRYLS